MKKLLLSLALIICVFQSNAAKEKETVALVSIDARGLELSGESIANLIRLELERSNIFEVRDKYDVNIALKANKIAPESCFGKSACVQVGKILETDKMVTGSIEKFGNKIIFILRLIDVKTEKVTVTSVKEYLNEQQEIQFMVQISVKDLLGLETDEHIENLLTDYNEPINTQKNTLKLNGPRMGMAIYTGENAKILSAPKSEGGFNSGPVTSMFGYQFEYQYIGSGDFQALLETIVAVNGVEQGKLIPSIAFINGFRFNKSGWEFGLGPQLKLTQQKEGYYDSSGKWTIKDGENPFPDGVTTFKRLDSRGDYEVDLGLIIAAGKTFKSGRLNFPVNVYYIPDSDGGAVGFSIGFNMAEKRD